MSGLADNPFLVLELPPAAGAREIEREAARLLGMLELGLAAAATYPTPLGPRTRTAEDVRAAAATLRDPRKRLVAELWAMGDADTDTGSGSGSVSDTGSGSVTGSGSGSDSDTGSVTGSGSGSDSDTGSVASKVTWPEAFTSTGWARR